MADRTGQGSVWRRKKRRRGLAQAPSPRALGLKMMVMVIMTSVLRTSLYQDQVV